jgi:hypothetical protein
MRGDGGGDCVLGFRGVMEEEEEVVSASASERTTRRRRRRWGAEANDGYSASSTDGGGSSGSGSGSFGCDSVGLCPLPHCYLSWFDRLAMGTRIEESLSATIVERWHAGKAMAPTDLDR